MKEITKNNILHHLQQMKYMGFKYSDSIELNTKENIISELPLNSSSLENTMLNCNLCSFSKSRKNILVGQGNLDADVIFLNMAPSIVEDEGAELLLGNSGTMLKKMAKNILKIDIEDIYILNILKCLPNKDIEESNIEINLCKPYIQKQLDIINPKLIIAFGNSYKYLTNDDKDISEIRGNMQYYNNIKIIPTYDPSFILRNPSQKKDVMNDLEKAKLLMDAF